ncbi:hypothetical protein HELRODRAFT_162349 [Helobdella robusta]|uniref:Uncharacterized protein n=1 Tax=Helobdella robusta TaxID=6412 RepID=T1ESJ5_HELRO|nr:hypothetical protein HELRODRAFT_162349 [Helobdella robusta]ESN98885.1 hypothetical protein HELRODRAFT_162349 [Helobdella robusta]
MKCTCNTGQRNYGEMGRVGVSSKLTSTFLLTIISTAASTAIALTQQHQRNLISNSNRNIRNKRKETYVEVVRRDESCEEVIQSLICFIQWNNSNRLSMTSKARTPRLESSK